MGILWLASKPPYIARHRRRRPLGDAAAVACYAAATLLGVVLLTAPGMMGR